MQQQKTNFAIRELLHKKSFFLLFCNVQCFWGNYYYNIADIAGQKGSDYQSLSRCKMPQFLRFSTRFSVSIFHFPRAYLLSRPCSPIKSVVNHRSVRREKIPTEAKKSIQKCGEIPGASQNHSAPGCILMEETGTSKC